MSLDTERFDQQTHDIDLEIGGMTCASCANRIEKKLNKIDGVRASVNMPPRRPESQRRTGSIRLR